MPDSTETAAKPVADIWFGVAPADAGLLRLRESHIAPFLAGNIWLLKGESAALLIDGGTGIVPLRPLIAALTPLPVIAVALNAYYDHAGALHEFDRRLGHAAEQAALENPTAASSAAEGYVSDAMLRALPWPGYSTAGYALQPAKLTRVLADGDSIDLGGRRLEVLHTPGMTPGSLCLWEPARGKLFSGDTIYIGPGGRTPKPSDPTAHRESLKRIAALPVAAVHPGHFEGFGATALTDAVARQLARHAAAQ